MLLINIQMQIKIKKIMSNSKINYIDVISYII